MLRTGGDGEYKNVDLFCRDTEVARQMKKNGDQAGNGKAESVHRKVMNMARCMFFRVLYLFPFEKLLPNMRRTF